MHETSNARRRQQRSTANWALLSCPWGEEGHFHHLAHHCPILSAPCSAHCLCRNERLCLRLHLQTQVPAPTAVNGQNQSLHRVREETSSRAQHATRISRMRSWSWKRPWTLTRLPLSTMSIMIYSSDMVRRSMARRQLRPRPDLSYHLGEAQGTTNRHDEWAQGSWCFYPGSASACIGSEAAKPQLREDRRTEGSIETRHYVQYQQEALNGSIAPPI